MGLAVMVCPGSHDRGPASCRATDITMGRNAVSPLEYKLRPFFFLATDAIRLGKDHPWMVKPLHKGGQGTR